MADQQEPMTQTPEEQEDTPQGMTLRVAMQEFAMMVGNFTNALISFMPGLTSAATTISQAAQQQGALASEINKLRQVDAGKKLKPEAPGLFDGTGSKAQGFLLELDMYFDALGIEDANQKIIYALSKVRGGTGEIATHWANSTRTLIQERKAAGGQYFNSWEQFKVTLTLHFVLQPSSETAIENLRALEMGNKTCEEYTVLFQGYAAQSGYNTPALLEEYKRGLNKQLRDKIYGLVPMPTTIDDWAAKACLLDKQYRIAKTQYGKDRGGQEKGKAPERRWTPRESTPVPTRDPNAMDIDRNRTPMICYTCGKQGHRSNACREALPGASCAYCKARGHRIADCKSPNKKPFGPVTIKTRANDFDLSAMPESEIAALKAKLQDF
ncbi:hypothetical protein H1R20_g9079, partial [Candolleomyces eurysporus]